MGVRAILQQGRSKPGMILPAEAAKQVNDVANKASLEKWVEGKAPGGNVQVEPAKPEAAAVKGGPLPVSDQETENGEKKATRDDDTLTNGIAAPDGTIVKGGEIEGDKVVGGTVKEVPDNLTVMEGVGEAMEQKLYEAGYQTFESIAEADKAELSEKVSGVSEESAHGLIKQGKKFSKLKAKGKL
jgi:hypothetical protein